SCCQLSGGAHARPSARSIGFGIAAGRSVRARPLLLVSSRTHGPSRLSSAELSRRAGRRFPEHADHRLAWGAAKRVRSARAWLPRPVADEGVIGTVCRPHVPFFVHSCATVIR